MLSLIGDYYRSQWPDLIGILTLATVGVWLAKDARFPFLLGMAIAAWGVSAMAHWLRWRAVLQDPAIHMNGAVLRTSIWWAGVGVLGTGLTILLVRKLHAPWWVQSVVSGVVGSIFVPLAILALLLIGCMTVGDCI